MFLVGLIMNGTLALLPTMLQILMNYPVLTTGLVTAPRGIGSMIAMFVVARMIDRVDNRLIILFGLLLTALSMWQMTEFSLAMGMQPIIVSGLIQGFGLGCTFVPLNTIALVEPASAHPDPGNRAAQPDAQSRRQHRHRRARGLADPEHPDRAFPPGRTTAAGQPAGSRALSRRALQPDDPSGIAALNAEVTRQAAMVAYINNFALMMIITIGSCFLLLLIRPSRPDAVAPALDPRTMRPRRAS